MEKEDLLESYSDFLEDISGDDDKSDEDWTPDNLSKEEKLSEGRVNIPIFLTCTNLIYYGKPLRCKISKVKAQRQKDFLFQ